MAVFTWLTGWLTVNFGGSTGRRESIMRTAIGTAVIVAGLWLLRDLPDTTGFLPPMLVLLFTGAATMAALPIPFASLLRS
jgi:hypothetical protein